MKKKLLLISALVVWLFGCLVKAEHLPAYLLGDANNDGVVDVSDITAIASYILGSLPESLQPKDFSTLPCGESGERGQEAFLDANGDGLIDVTDITSTSLIILGKPERSDMTFSATQEENGSTRASLSGLNIIWDSGDKIGVYEGALAAQEFTLSSGAGTTTGQFTGEASTAQSTYYALSPYQSDAKLDYSTGIISDVSLPYVQYVEANTFDPKAALIVGKSTNLSFTFVNMFACIKIVLDEDMAAKGVKSISFMDNTGKAPLAGTFNLDVTNYNITWTSEGNKSSMVSILPKSGGTFSAGTYYITVLPATIQAQKNAFLISFATNNGIFYKTYNTVKKDGTTANPLNIKRNKIITITASTPKQVEEWVDMGEDVNSKNVYWRSWNLGASHPYESGDYYAWAETEVKYTGFGSELHESTSAKTSTSESTTSYYYDINMKSSMGSDTKYQKYDSSKGYDACNTPYYQGYTTSEYSKYTSGDSKTTLETADDVAYQLLYSTNSTAQIPTKGNIEYLINSNNCIWREVKDYLGMGVGGYVVVSKEASTLGNMIFIPYSGLCQQNGRYLHKNKQTAYWSNTLDTSSRSYAYCLYLNNDSKDITEKSCNPNGRYMGLLVRPVKLSEK